MKRSVSIDFCDFSPNFRKTDNFYYRVLRERFDVEICDQPDFLLYGCYGHEHRMHSGVRVFVGWEPLRPDFKVCDYSVGCLKLDDPRHLQLPLYVIYGEATELIKQQDEPSRTLAGKSKFCSFVVADHKPSRNCPRARFFRLLSRYKRVDSGGRYLNNMGGTVPRQSRGKIVFLRDYKFNIAFENSSLPGYTTEKIFEPMVARCLPIYWGNPDVAEEFNPRSFLNYGDFPDEEALIERIRELDRDDGKYLEYVRQPYFHRDTPSRFWDRQRVLDFFEAVFSTSAVPVAQRRKRKWFFFGRWLLLKRHHWHPPVTPPAPDASAPLPP